MVKQMEWIKNLSLVGIFGKEKAEKIMTAILSGKVIKYKPTGVTVQIGSRFGYTNVVHGSTPMGSFWFHSWYASLDQLTEEGLWIEVSEILAVALISPESVVYTEKDYGSHDQYIRHLDTPHAARCNVLTQSPVYNHSKKYGKK